jgi:hypothetical protein
VGQDGAPELAWVSKLVEDLDAHERMAVRTLMLLVVEIVQEPDHTPGLGILAELPGVATHRGLDGQHVGAQVGALGVLGDETPGVFPRFSVDGHEFLRMEVEGAVTKYNRSDLSLPIRLLTRPAAR